MWALVAGMVMAFYLLRSSDREGYYRFVREDGVAESLQAVMLLSTAVLGGLTSRVLLRGKEKLLGGAFAVLALGGLLVFAEEISWGQRIVGWESFGYFAEQNFQKETNIHNDAHLRFFLDPAVLAASVLAAGSALLHHCFMSRGAYRLSFLVSELPAAGFFLVCAGVYTVYLYLNPVIKPHYNGFDVFFWQDLEMAETFFATGVVITALLKYRAACVIYGRKREEIAVSSETRQRVELA